MTIKNKENRISHILICFIILSFSFVTAITSADFSRTDEPEVATPPSPIMLGNWTFFGLENTTVLSLATTTDYLYAGAYTAGVYRKHITDPNANWEYLGFGEDEKVTELYINPLAPEVIYLGLDYPGGFYRSDNSGDTWVPLYPPLNDGGYSYRISEIAGPKNAPETLYVTSRTTVLRSEDSGQYWTQLWRSQNVNINTIALDPSNDSRLWVGGETNLLMAFLIKSINCGETWDWCDLPYTGDNAVDAIAIHPNDSNTLYLGMEGKVLKTTSGGQRWRTVLSPTPFRYFYGLIIHPLTPNCIYAGGAASYPYIPLEIWKSTTGGSFWSHSVEERGVNIATIIFDSTNYNILYIGSIGSGVWRFTQPVIQQVE